jgi:hypothetical protein
MKKILQMFVCAGMLVSPVTGICAKAQAPDQVAVNSWLSTHSKSGNCKVSFPTKPEHMQQMLPVPEQNTHLSYDVYVAGFETESVYMMLIAEYPTTGMNNYAEVNLENFLNGILSQNPNNKLIFADMTEVHGHKALDFFIRTKGVFFKGRAIITDKHLYLLAMECEMKNYNEEKYNIFLNSFEFTK